MNDRVALLLHLETPPTLDDDAMATWWADAGAPLVEVLVETGLPVGLALAGPLLGWVSDARPSGYEALSTVVGSGQVELVSTPFHGPVVSAVPMDDFTDQVLAHLTLVRRLFEVRPHGAWLPRQVWDPITPRVMGRADIAWVPVDDGAIAAHHPHRGVDPWGAFRTEREGHPLTLLANDAGAQALRGLASPDEVVVYLRGRHSQGAHDVVLSWNAARPGQDPGTEIRWILGVVRALAGARHAAGDDALHVVCPTAITDRVRGRIYLPSSAVDGAPWERRILERPAADLLHKRMLRVSRLLTRLSKRVRRQAPDAPDPDQLLQARRYLHRAQAAAHYEQPGIDDPELLHRGWRDLLRAEDVAERAAGTWQRLAAETVDLTTGGRDQVYLRTSSWVAVVDPALDAGCPELGFLPGAMNLVDTTVGEGGGGAFVERFRAPASEPDGPPAGPEGDRSAYEVHSVERAGDRSVRAMLSARREVPTAEGPRWVEVHKGFDVRNDHRLDVALEVHVAGDGPVRTRFAVGIPLSIGTSFDDVLVKVDDQTKAVGPEGLESIDTRSVDLAGDTVGVRVAFKERVHLWLSPRPLGAVLWVEWPLEALTDAPARRRIRIDARVIEQLDEGDGVPMRVVEEGPKVGDTVVLQRTVPVDAPVVPAHAAVAPSGVDKVSRALHLVPPRGPASRPQRLPLWSPLAAGAVDEESEASGTEPEEEASASLPSDPLDAPVLAPRDDATPSGQGGEE